VIVNAGKEKPLTPAAAVAAATEGFNRAIELQGSDQALTSILNK
jgi:hypothetical protein